MGKTQKSYHSNILTISGTGRNVGKTSLACGIIHKFGRDQRLTAVKISPHFHPVDYPMPLTEKPGAYSLYKEDRKDSGKDSSKMLAAGANQVFYIQTMDDHLNDAWKKLSELINSDVPVVVESGGLEDMLKPGLSILVTNHGGMDLTKTGSTNNERIEICFEHFDQLINRIRFKNGNWELSN
jgi:hypothetical protein